MRADAAEVFCVARVNPLRYSAMRTQYGEDDVQRVIDQLTSRIASAFDPAAELTLVGIRTRGEILAQDLSPRLEEMLELRARVAPPLALGAFIAIGGGK